MFDSSVPRVARAAMLFSALVVSSQPAVAQFQQQGSKLVGTGAAGNAGQGASVALSADGNTAIVGALLDNSGAGAAWVFTRSGGVWKQQGSKLVGTGAVGSSNQGTSVALSADGNTAIVGGSSDNSNAGAVWIFTRTGKVWTQQGTKLVGAGAVGNAAQGISVALSADGNTAIIGGPGDSSNAGAAWVFTRSGSVWNQQGGKLVGSGANGAVPNQGTSVALSANGNTAIVGGRLDSAGTGATWVFTRSGGVWSQQGNKLVGTDSIGASRQGGEPSSIALSANGNIAFVGGASDNDGFGAAWAFKRSGSVWSQQGGKLVGSGATPTNVFGSMVVAQGVSVALSGDGNIAIVGGYRDSAHAGAVWVFARDSSGVWKQQGSKFRGTGAIGSGWQGRAVALSADGNTLLVGGGGDNAGAGAVWVFVAKPTVSGVSPNSGSVNGKTKVTITGKNFTGATAVKFGTTTAASFTVNSATKITAVTPTHAQGLVPVTVTAPAGSGIKTKAYTFIALPIVSAVSPSSGPVKGKTKVTITGKNFTGATAVKFGTTAAASFNVNNATKITALTPKHAKGVVAVTVTTPAGRGSKSKAYTFK